MKTAIYEKDVLYSAKDSANPGIAKIEVYAPDNSGSIPVIVRQKSPHDPLEYISNIMDILQTDFFERIRTDLINNGIIYVMKTNDSTYYHVKFSEDGSYTIEEIEDIDL